MQNLLEKLDELAGIETESRIAKWLERLAFIFLVLMTLSAPHSIAATQTAWLLGMVFWIARFFIEPRPAFNKTALFLPFAAFFGWSVITCFTSYAPDISFDKLRNVGLFVIFFFAVNNLRTRKAVKFIAFALIFSCMVNVVWTPISRLLGRGVEIQNVSAESPLLKVAEDEMKNGDTIVEVNGKKVSTPEEVLSEIESKEISDVFYYRPDYYKTIKVSKSNLLNGENALAKLGVGNWKTSRNWRSAGFYSHYTTYAEVLQLLASLVLGIFIIGFSPQRHRDTENFDETESKIPKSPLLLFSSTPLLLFICFALMGLALLLTVTRASQGAFMFSAFSILLLGASRKLFLTAVLISIPAILIGLYVLQQSRQVGYVDTNDNSITWRQTVYREGFELWIQSPRHFLLGVGLDSIRRYKDEWGMFDNGKLPSSHLHSTPLQLAVERGLPALLFWLLILGIYKWKMFRALRRNEFEDWIEKGIILGAFGGLIGFFISGIVHYNLGDGEIAMVFYLIMALAMKLVEINEIKE